MKSWIAFLLPTDEYKEKRILYFVAEGTFILLFSLIALLISSKYIPIFKNQIDTILFLPIAVFIIYVLIRYILSGMEYTDVVSETSFKKERNHITFRSAIFASTFILFLLIFEGLPNEISKWAETIVLPIFAGFFWFIINYISLQKSYKKNKELA
ncbi:DUF3278 domain-containing protein [Ornithinibacillus sp. 4-3]|uniref:DUF3278 domain-containing protein n=1 Tax=Ornithinibacillus sp. 4-3 TaxID=3231488 RepID=A0AB39HR63_9BACI